MTYYTRRFYVKAEEAKRRPCVQCKGLGHNGDEIPCLRCDGTGYVEGSKPSGIVKCHEFLCSCSICRAFRVNEHARDMAQYD